ADGLLRGRARRVVLMAPVARAAGGTLAAVGPADADDDGRVHAGRIGTPRGSRNGLDECAEEIVAVEDVDDREQTSVLRRRRAPHENLVHGTVGTRLHAA